MIEFFTTFAFKQMLFAASVLSTTILNLEDFLSQPSNLSNPPKHDL